MPGALYNGCHSLGGWIAYLWHPFRLKTSKRMYGLTIISAVILTVLFANGMLEDAIEKIATPLGGDIDPMLACVSGGATLLVPGLFLATAGYLHECETTTNDKRYYKVYRDNKEVLVVHDAVERDEPCERTNRVTETSSKFATASMAIGFFCVLGGIAACLIMGCVFSQNEAAFNMLYLTIPLVTVYGLITLTGIIGFTALHYEKKSLEKNIINEPLPSCRMECTIGNVVDDLAKYRKRERAVGKAQARGKNRPAVAQNLLKKIEESANGKNAKPGSVRKCTQPEFRPEEKTDEAEVEEEYSDNDQEERITKNLLNKKGEPKSKTNPQSEMTMEALTLNNARFMKFMQGRKNADIEMTSQPDENGEDLTPVPSEETPQKGSELINLNEI